jgi:steroid delta-isomerase-like uncharacterized protein
VTISNRDLAKRFIEEAVNGRNLDVIDETVTEDFAYIDPTIGTIKGQDGLKDLMSRLFSAFPDLVWTVEEEVSDGNTLASRYSWTATQDGNYRAIPATHKKVTTSGVSINKISDGRLAETRMFRDDLGLLRQLGAIPEQPAHSGDGQR